ncbi:MAG: alpha/beta hydrolase [archaeon]|nr:alpha/beta hydrolase [archaeon]
MPFFTNDGIRIYYEIEGEGLPLIMIHGFATSLGTTWTPRCVKTLKKNNRLILIDCRGHGKSDKPHDDSDYGPKMTKDVIKLMEHLSIEKANFLGHSMGAYMIYRLLFSKPEIFISAILAGFVVPLIEDEERLKYDAYTKLIIEALRAESSEQIEDPSYRLYRQITEKSGNDLLALAALYAGDLKERTANITSPAQLKKALKKIRVPVMTVVGSGEMLPGDKTLAAQLIPNACHFQIQGKDHLSVLRDSKFPMVVKAFIDHVNRK